MEGFEGRCNGEEVEFEFYIEGNACCLASVVFGNAQQEISGRKRIEDDEHAGKG